MSDARVDVLIQGYPGASASNGGMGWSTVALIRTLDRVVLVDTGPMGVRELLRTRLAEFGLQPAEVTDVVLTHAHHDHSINWVMFPNARVHISAAELEWAVAVAPGSSPVPELYVDALAASPQLALIAGAAEILPGVRVEPVPGHTPGSLLVIVDGGRAETIFAGDAAKSRAEVLSRRAVSSMDAKRSTDSIDLIVDRWNARPGTILVPGHDLPMQIAGGEVRYLASRDASVEARLGADVDDVTSFSLAGD